MTEPIDSAPAPRPKVALLGEFSAGKSTLANVLLGTAQSPVRVTATQMPPIWYCWGNGMPVRLRQDDVEEALDPDQITEVSLDGTKAVQVPLMAPFLERFDLMDMPGSSDPNMTADIWDGLLPLADIVIWCTPATQAWRQSEAAIWDALPDTLRQRSLLLVTRADKIGSERDRQRLLTRLARETEGGFRAILPVSLVHAAGEPSADTASGMDAVMSALEALVTNPVPEPVATHAAPEAGPSEPAAEASAPRIMPRRVNSLSSARPQRGPRRVTPRDALI